MTCIVAVVENGVPYFAGDSLVVNLPGAYYAKANQTVRREPKIFQKNGMFFGYNGSVSDPTGIPEGLSRQAP